MAAKTAANGLQAIRITSRLLLGLCVWGSTLLSPAMVEAGKGRGRPRILQRWHVQIRGNQQPRQPATPPSPSEKPPMADGASQSVDVSALGGASVPYPVFHYGNSQNVSSATNGQAWTYNSSAGKWEPSTISAGTSTLDDLTDVVISSPADDQYLRYTGSGWVNETVSAAGLATPDNLTTVSKSSIFNPRDYGASYLDTDSYVTWATTTATATFDSSTDIVTTASAHGLTDGDGVAFTTGGTLPTAVGGDIAAETRYYVDVLSSTTFSLHRTRALATAGTSDIDFTGTGSGTHTARLKTTVTFNNSSGTPTAASNDYVAGNWLLLMRGGVTCTLTAPQITFDGATASYTTKIGTDPTFTAVAATNIVTLSSDKPFATADPVRVSSSTTLPGGLAAATTYYGRRLTGTSPVTATTMTLHPTANDATNNTNVIDITDTGTGTHTMVGYTTFYATARAGDGNGGFTAASTDITALTWNYRSAGDMTTAIKYRFDVPQGASSMAIYGYGSSGRDLSTVLDAEGLRFGPSLDDSVGQFTTVDSNAGNARLNNTGIGTYYSTGDVIELNATSSGDTEYDVKKQVLSATSNSITINQAFSDTAVGYINEAFVEHQDYGQILALKPYKGIPDMENPSYTRRSSVVYPIGTTMLDATNDRMWEAYEWTGDMPFSGRSGSSAPSWSTAVANTKVADGEIIIKRSLEWVPLEDTSGAVRGALRAKVQSVPTTTTAVLQDAAFADNASNALYCTHDDTMPLRNCIAAMQTWDRGATLDLSAGTLPVYSPKLGAVDPDGVTWYTNVKQDVQTNYALFVLGDDDYSKNIALRAHPAFTLRWRAFQSASRIDAVTYASSTSTPQGLWDNISLFAINCPRFTCTDFRVIWSDFSGGMSEHDNSGSTEKGMGLFTSTGHIFSAISGQVATDYRFNRVTAFVPTFMNYGGIDDNYKFWNQVKCTFDHCHIAFGGGDGNQSVGLEQGHFHSSDCWWGNYKRLSSHAHYWNSGKYDYFSSGDHYYGIDTPNKFTIQLRGASADTPIRQFKIDNLIGMHCAALLLGDQTSENPVQNGQVSNISGVSSISLAECENVQLANILVPVSLAENNRDITIDGLNGSLKAQATIGGTRGLLASNINNADLVALDNVSDSRVTRIKFRHNFVSSVTSVVNDTYSWVVTPTAGEYRLYNRATGGTPGISQPTHVVIDGHVVPVATSGAGSLVAGQATWQDPDSLGYSGLIVKLVDTTYADPDSAPYDFVQTAVVTGYAQGLNLGDFYNTTVEGVEMLRTDGQTVSPVQTQGGNAVTWVKSKVKGLRSISYGVVNASDTYRVFDWGTSECTLIDSGVEDIFLRQYNSTDSGDIHVPFRLFATDHSRYFFRDVDTAYLTGGGGGWDIQGGRGELERCKIQGNRSLAYIDTTTDALVFVTAAHLDGNAAAGGNTTITYDSDSLTFDDAYNGLEILAVHSTGEIEWNTVIDYVGSTKIATVQNQWEKNPTTATKYYTAYQNYSRDIITANPVPIRLYGENTFPSALDDASAAVTVPNRTFWTRDDGMKIWETKSAASVSSSSTTGDILFSGTNAVVWVEQVDFANAAYFSSAEPIDANTLDWVVSAKDVNLRGGGGAWTYAQVTADTGNVQLQPVDTHIFSSNADTNEISGFLGINPGERKLIVNSEYSTNDLLLDHQDSTATTTLLENEIDSPTAADYVLDPGDSCWVYRPTYGGRLKIQGN